MNMNSMKRTIAGILAMMTMVTAIVPAIVGAEEVEETTAIMTDAAEGAESPAESPEEEGVAEVPEETTDATESLSEAPEGIQELGEDIVTVTEPVQLIGVGDSEFTPICLAANTPDISLSANNQKKIVNFFKPVAIKGLCSIIPGGEFFSPMIENLFDMTIDGIYGEEKQMSIEDLQKEMTSRFDALDAQISELKDEIKTNTTFLANTTVLASFGAELDKMHEDTEFIRRQINTISGSTSLNDREKAVQIANLIGNNGSWNSKIINHLNAVRTILIGGSYKDFGGRDLFTVLYDLNKGSCMFSGEVYDMNKAYIDRVMLEYEYAYIVAMECLAAHNLIAQFTPEEVEALEYNTRNMYHQIYTITECSAAEAENLTNGFLDAESADSILSHYAVYKKNTDNRTVFINKGIGDPIQLSKNLWDRKYSVYDGSLYHYTIDVINGINNDFDKNPLTDAQKKALNQYITEKYGTNQSMKSFLENTIGFNQIKGSLMPIGHAAQTGTGFAIIGIDWQLKVDGVKMENTDASSEKRLEKKHLFQKVLMTPFMSYPEIYNSEMVFVGFSRAEAPEIGGNTASALYGAEIELADIIANDTESPRISAEAYVHEQGWKSSDVVIPGVTAEAGTTGKGLAMEGLVLNGTDQISYRAHVSNEGWQNWKNSGETAGTIGRSIEAVEIKLEGELADKYDVMYKVHMANKGWGDWVMNGETAGTTGESRAIEAIQIQLIAK